MKLFAAILVILVAAVVGAVAGLAWITNSNQVDDATRAAPAGGSFVKAADVQIFVQQAGPADGTPVLFVHGTGAWSEAWREPMNALAKDGRRAIAIDLPPFGYSGRPQPPSYSKVDQGKRILGVLDALQIQKAVLVAHSFGGGPAMEAVLLAPGRFQAVVLVDAALSIAPEGVEQVAPPSFLARTVLASRVLRNTLAGAFLANPRFTRTLLTKFIDDPARATDDWVEVYRRPLHVAGTTAAVGDWLPALLAPGALAASERPGSYASLGMPLFLIWGERDTITPLAQAQRLAKLAPAVELTVMNNVGHIPQIEDTAAFTALLRQVVAKASSPSSNR